MEGQLLKSATNRRRGDQQVPQSRLVFPRGKPSGQEGLKTQHRTPTSGIRSRWLGPRNNLYRPLPQPTSRPPQTDSRGRIAALRSRQWPAPCSEPVPDSVTSTRSRLLSGCRGPKRRRSHDKRQIAPEPSGPGSVDTVHAMNRVGAWNGEGSRPRDRERDATNQGSRIPSTPGGRASRCATGRRRWFASRWAP